MFCAVQVAECYFLCSASSGMLRFVLCKWRNATFCALQVAESHVLCSVIGGSSSVCACPDNGEVMNDIVSGLAPW